MCQKARLAAGVGTSEDVQTGLLGQPRHPPVMVMRSRQWRSRMALPASACGNTTAEHTVAGGYKSLPAARPNERQQMLLQLPGQPPPGSPCRSRLAWKSGSISRKSSMVFLQSL